MTPAGPNPAPADSKPRQSWPLWKKALAYLLLAAMALIAIWYIDLKAHDSVSLRPVVTTSNC